MAPVAPRSDAYDVIYQAEPKTPGNNFPVGEEYMFVTSP